MLGDYTDPTPLRIIGIDPGTETLGVSVLDVSLTTNQIVLQYVSTYTATQLIRLFHLQWISQVHGDRIARLKAHEENLYSLFTTFRPHEIVSESPYLGRFPAAYAALVECMSVIRSAVMRYDFRMPLHTLDPPTVKTRLGVSGKSGDKTHMREGLLRLPDLENPQRIPIELLDEHSIDAMAVAYTRARYVTQCNRYG
jgi:Holliday junction resolvasome RuvABC endonuclease subunit